MKKIYSETIRDSFRSPYKKLEVWYPTMEEPLLMPSLIYLETGWGEEAVEERKWVTLLPPSDDVSSEARVVRRAIALLDELKLPQEGKDNDKESAAIVAP